MKTFQTISRRLPPLPYKRITRYFGLAGLFFALSFVTIYFVYHHFSKGQLRIPPNLFSVQVVICLLLLLVLYFVADGLRLYCIIRSMGSRIAFTYILRLVFINIFVSNVTPLATGGGVVQIYFMQQRGMPIGEATAATSIRTMLAALILFTLTPVILWSRPALFHVFFHKHILYSIPIISLGYLFFFWLIVFRIRMIKFWLFRGMNLLYSLRILSRLRFRSLYLRISDELDLFSGGVNRYFKGDPAWAILSFVCTAFFLLLLFSFSVVLLKAIGYRIPTSTILVLQVVVTFFMYFAPTPGASGVAEAGYGLLFAQLVQQQDITLLTLSWRFLTIYVGMIIGIVILYNEVIKQRKSRRAIVQ